MLEEIALYKDKPHFFLYEQALQDFFEGHTAGNSVLGTTDSISAVSRDEMHAYFSRRYAPNNIVLVASGNFDWEQFAADAEKYCSAWVAQPTPRNAIPHTPKAMYKVYKKKDLNQTHLLFLSGSASAQEDERYPLGLLAMILGDGTGSKMYWELVNEGLVESAGADTDERDGTGCFMASASTEADKLDQVIDIMKKILSKPLDFDDAELERAKNKLSAKVVMSGELPMGRLMAMGTEYQYRGKVTPLSEIVQKISKVTKRDIAKALEKYPLTTWGEFRLVAE